MGGCTVRATVTHQRSGIFTLYTSPSCWTFRPARRGWTYNFVKRLKKKVPRPACCDGAQKINVDDQHGNNVLGLRRHRYGRDVKKADRQTFHDPSLDIVTSKQREQYFSVGNETNAPSDQIEVILHATGEKGWGTLGKRMRWQENWPTALTGGNA